jgi:hypothetical protein
MNRSEHATCIDVSAYGDVLSYGTTYTVLATAMRANRQQIKVRADNGNTAWFPVECFDLSGNDAVSIQAITIRDALETADRAAIEAEIELSTGERRCCAFASPGALQHFGDMLPDGQTRIHYSSHLIIVDPLNETTITQTLNYLLAHNALLAHTKAL